MRSRTLTAGIVVSMAIHAAILLFPRLSGNNHRAETGHIEVGIVYQAAPPCPSAPSLQDQNQDHQSLPLTLAKNTDKSTPSINKHSQMARQKPTPAKPVKQKAITTKETFKIPEIHTDTPIIQDDNSLYQSVEPNVPPASALARADSYINDTHTDWSTVRTSSPPLTATSPTTGRTYEHGPSVTIQKNISRSARYHFNPPPNYPSLALKRRWQGEVLLRVEVDEQGEVVGAIVKNSSGHSLLDDTALKTVWNWKFHPARSGNNNVSEQVLLPIRFELPKS